jgi:hypothetical protein
MKNRTMKNGPRLQALAARHAELEEALRVELARPLPDLAAVRSMKRRKLILKDEMASSRQPETA